MDLLRKLLLLAGAGIGAAAADCRCLPSDECWPSESTWSAFNATVGGRLIKTVPIGSPCHDPNYDADACAALQSQWLLPSLHVPSSSSVMQIFWANQSCDPFTSQEQSCELGNYVAYSVDVGTPDHVAETLKFAKKNNIRINIRNSGHDYLGRSTGAGALSIWTHNLKSTEFIASYKSKAYSGAAFRIGAGVSGAEAAEGIDGTGFTVVGGECPSVGLAGGFTQGGGHSTLSTSYGLAADQVLQYEVVTAGGKITTASLEKNADLYWALSGGGAGNFAVVTSMTVRAHPVGDIGGGTILIQKGDLSQETYTDIIKKFHGLAPAMVDQGASISYVLTGTYFKLNPFTVVNSTGEAVENEIAGPFLDYLKEIGVTPTTVFSTLSFYDHYNKYLGPLPYGSLPSSIGQYGSRLIPRSAFENNSTTVSDVMVSVLSNAAALLGSIADYSSPHTVHNAVLPAWRDTLVQLQVMTPWSTDPSKWSLMLEYQKAMTEKLLPPLKAVTPNSATYMNEADFREPNWKSEFFGANYAKLLVVKKLWDPESLLYAFKGVGSDAWDVDANGRMCRT